MLLSCDNVPHDDIYYDEYRSSSLPEELFFFPIVEIKGHNDTPFIRIDFYINLHGFKMIQHYDDRSGSISPKMKILEIRGVMEIISKINVDMVLSFS